MRNRPLWRWWLFCFALWLGFRTGWRWAWVGRLYSWSVLPEWLATPDEIEAARPCDACGHSRSAHGLNKFLGCMELADGFVCGCRREFPEVSRG